MSQLETQHYRRNFVLIVADYVLFGMAMSLVNASTVLPELVRRLTNSAPLVGLVIAVWNGTWLVPQLWAAQALSHHVYKKPAMLIAGLIGRPAFLIISAGLLAGASERPVIMIGLLLASILLFWCADAFCTIAWFDIVAKAVPVERRGRLFGLAQVLSGLLALGVAAFVSLMLGPGGPPFPSNYAWLFGLASALVLVGLGALAVMHEPPERAPQEQVGWQIFISQLVVLLRQDAAFRQVIAGRLLDGLSALAMPFFVIYASDVLRQGPQMIGLFIAAQTVGGMVASVGLGALAERVGFGAVIRVAVVANLSGPLMALLTYPWREATWLWAPYSWVFVAMGAANSAVMLGWMNYVLEIAPPGQRPVYTGLTNTLTGLLIPVPILGGWLLQATSYPVLFAAAAAGPLLALGLVRTLPVPVATKGNAE